MRMLQLVLLTLLTTLAPIATLADPHINGVMTANAGTRFTLGLPDENGDMLHTVDGVAQVSVIGNCVVHFDVIVSPGPKAEGTMYFLYPKDGSILRLKVVGTLRPEEGSPVVSFHYDVEVISGEGQFAGARGKGEIDGAAMFINNDGDGTATWTFRGNVFTRPAK